jgi:hypothetical protein
MRTTIPFVGIRVQHCRKASATRYWPIGPHRLTPGRADLFAASPACHPRVRLINISLPRPGGEVPERPKSGRVPPAAPSRYGLRAHPYLIDVSARISLVSCCPSPKGTLRPDGSPACTHGAQRRPIQRAPSSGPKIPRLTMGLCAY